MESNHNPLRQYDQRKDEQDEYVRHGNSMNESHHQWQNERIESFADKYFAMKLDLDKARLLLDRSFEQGKMRNNMLIQVLENSENSTLNSLKNYFLSNIPIPSILLLKENTPNLFISLSIFAYGIVIGIFFYVFITGIISGTTNKYISLDANSGNCDTYFTFLYTEQYVSQNGVWEGTSTFNYNAAKYLINFKAFYGANYSAYMKYIFGEVVSNIAETAKTKPLYWNLVIWSTYMNYMYTKKGVTTFQFTGEAKSIFDRYYFFNIMGSSQGSCTGAISGYDGSSGEMYMGWNMICNSTTTCNSLYNYSFPPSYSQCSKVLTPVALEFIFWVPGRTGSNLKITLDAVSIMTAVSLNLGISNGTELEYSGYDFQNVLKAFYDARTPDMQSIFCTYDAQGTNVDTSIHEAYPPYCYVKIYDGFCVPAIVPYYEQCLNCTSYNNCKDSDSCDSSNSVCNQITLLAACVYDPMYAYVPWLSGNYTQPDLYAKIQRAAYETLTIGRTPSIDEWCPGCIIYVNSVSENKDANSYQINRYRYELEPQNSSEINGGLVSNYGHCEDSFSVPYTSWSRLIASPPAPLVESYYQCTKTTSQILIDSFGIASSNAFTIGIPLILITLYLLFKLNSKFKMFYVSEHAEDTLTGRRRVHKTLLEEKMYEHDFRYRKAVDAYQKALKEFQSLHESPEDDMNVSREARNESKGTQKLPQDTSFKQIELKCVHSSET